MSQLRAGRFGEDAHVFLQRRDQVGHDLQRHDDLGADRRRTMCSASAAWMSFSDSGSTSQNDSVKSNGVWEIAQKFA